MDTRSLARLALAAAAFSMAGVATAEAASDCKKAVVAEGKPAALRDLGAYPNSLLAWRSAVKEKYGSEYNSWRYADKREVICDEGSKGWVCTRTAVPCKDVLHTLLDGTMKKKNCKDESLSSYGRREKSEEAAIEQATWGWKLDAGKNYGKEWSDWDNAAEGDFDCRKGSRGI